MTRFSIRDFLTNKRYRIRALDYLGVYNLLPDKFYLEQTFYSHMGKPLDLENPMTYSEKIQWLKLYDRHPEYTSLVDKYEVKSIVSKKIGEQYVIPTLGVWNHYSEIDFDDLPNQFVLKCTHDSGGVYICKDKKSIDHKKVGAFMEKALRSRFYKKGREWPYKNIVPKIIAEEYMEDKETTELRDYKFFCFNGQPKALFIASDRQVDGEETKFDFFDMDFNHLPFTNGHPNANVLPECPVRFEKMKELAKKLSAGYPHVRVDFYEVDGKVYFGELTFAHWSGLMPFDPEEWDYTFGEWLQLPAKKC